MRPLRLVLFVLASTCLAAQLVSYTYTRWLEKHDSVLDKYDQVGTEIQSATTLEALDRRYSEELNKEKAKAAAEKAAGCQPAPYQEPATQQLWQAIMDWERKENAVRELRFFWLCGVAFLILAALFRWRSWLWPAVVLEIASVGEMVWWTSPSRVFSGAHQEVARLLDNKLLLSGFSLLLLGVYWIWTGLLRSQKASGGETDRTPSTGDRT